MVQCIIISPIGKLKLQASERGLYAICFVDNAVSETEIPSQLKEAVKQLDEYFNKQRTGFDLLLDIQGSDFQKLVWKALQNIPYGETISYKLLAENIQKPKAIRAVGGANNKNKLPIVIPCHRVIGAKGNLVGYAGGIEMKKWLLDFEAEF